MAKITYASPVDEIRGTLNGLVFSANKAGAYIRRRNNRQTFKSDDRQSQQLTFTVEVSLWASLSGAQQTAWDTWAALPAQARTDSLGNSYYLSGFQAFLSVNLWHRAFSTTLLTAPPTLPKPTTSAINDTFAGIIGGNPFVSIRTSNGTLGTDLPVIFLAVMRSSDAIVHTPNFFLIPSVIDAGTPNSWWDCDMPTYIEKFGTPDVTHRVFFNLFIQDTAGYRSLVQHELEDFVP